MQWSSTVLDTQYLVKKNNMPFSLFIPKPDVQNSTELYSLWYPTKLASTWEPMVCFISTHPICTYIRWLHTYRLRLLRNTAVETQPEFAHACSPKYKWAPRKFPNLHLGSCTEHVPQEAECPMMPNSNCTTALCVLLGVKCLTQSI